MSENERCGSEGKLGEKKLVQGREMRGEEVRENGRKIRGNGGR